MGHPFALHGAPCQAGGLEAISRWWMPRSGRNHRCGTATRKRPGGGAGSIAISRAPSRARPLGLGLRWLRSCLAPPPANFFQASGLHAAPLIRTGARASARRGLAGWGPRPVLPRMVRGGVHGLHACSLCCGRVLPPAARGGVQASTASGSLTASTPRCWAKRLSTSWEMVLSVVSTWWPRAAAASKL